MTSKILATVVGLLVLEPVLYCQTFQLTHGSSDGPGYISPTFSPDGKMIAFASSKNKTYHIWTMDVEGKSLREISQLTWDMSPAWSPDSKKIAFNSYGKDRRESQFALWIVDADGTNPHQIIEPVGRGDQYPCWSPDGRKIVWTHGDQLWVIDSDGKNAHALTRKPAKAYEYCGQWSPNGKLIAYVAADTYDSSHGEPYKIWLVEPSGQNQRILRSGISATGIKWSKDGKSLYYNSGQAVMGVDLDGVQPLRKLAVWSNENNHFDISSDEKWFIYDDTGDDVAGNIYKRRLQ